MANRGLDQEMVLQASKYQSYPCYEFLLAQEIRYEEHTKWHGGIVTKINKVENHIDDPVSLYKET